MAAPVVSTNAVPARGVDLLVIEADLGDVLMVPLLLEEPDRVLLEDEEAVTAVLWLLWLLSSLKTTSVSREEVCLLKKRLRFEWIEVEAVVLLLFEEEVTANDYKNKYHYCNNTKRKC